jgi:phage terminase Nu1 subunit (DNA packaging protein)
MLDHLPPLPDLPVTDAQRVLERVTLSDFAQRAGLSLPAVSKAVGEGRIVRGLDGLLEWPTEFDRYVSNTRMDADRLAAFTGIAGADVALDFQGARSRLTAAKAEQEEMKLKQLRGELIPVQDALAVAGGILQTLKERLQLLPDKLALQLAQTRNPVEVRRILYDGIADTLQVAADSLSNARFDNR